jgi:hypothetical protein
VPFRGEEQTTGLAAALALQEVGGPAILEFDPLSGSLLMERIVPGTPLCDSDLTEDERFEVFSGIVRRIHALPAESGTFLHGDLHHENILWDGGARAWRPIDPKGGFGEPEMDGPAWLRNPFRQFGSVSEIQSLTLRRRQRMEDDFGWSGRRVLALALTGLDDLLGGLDSGHPWHRYAEAIRSLAVR